MPIYEPEIKCDDNLCRLRVGDWLWRSLYARLWWSAVPIYWAAMAASSRVELFSAFFSSAFAGFVNVFFFPPLVALILSYGFLKAWLSTAEFDPDIASAEHAEEFFARRRKRYGPSGMLREFDPLDPASGSNWIGSPLNPSNPFYIIRHRHPS
ncbi:MULTISPECIES: hypothetical protein [Sphingobium]|jgi:hypothetical protein|uniref:hypothetical protein n=1 Tax=Sphingobium TaxID=165695 RepID=UPI000E769440|nr:MULTISPECIES: hypothetical protein [Sphingobium]KAA9016508.1 hypothetical protein F4U94_09370 [Sphingobium limneticum]